MHVLKSLISFEKPLFFVIVLSLVCASLSSQIVTVSPEIILRDDYSFALLGEVDEKVLLIRNKGYTQTLSIYNDGLGFIQEIPLEFEDRKINVIGFVTGPSDFNIYYSFRSGSNEYVKSVKLSSSGEKFYQDTIFKRENIFLSEYYKFQGSENDRYVCLFNIVDDETLQLMFYDNQEMELIYEKRLVVKGVSMRRDFRNIEISNSGEMAILFEKNNAYFRHEYHYFRLINFSKDGETEERKYDMKGISSVDSKLIVDNKNEAFKIVGLYSEDFENVSNGYFVNKRDKIELKAFPELMLVDNSANSKRKVNGLEDYTINDVIFRQDGGFLMVMESNKELHKANAASRGYRGNAGYRLGITDYYNEDILVLSINPDGNFQWNNVLPKKQFSQDDEGIYSSFFIFKTPSKLHFVYNDEIKNNNTVSEYVLNPAGVFERNSVLSTAYQKLKLRIRSSIQVSNNAFLLTSERNSRLNIVKIEY